MRHREVLRGSCICSADEFYFNCLYTEYLKSLELPMYKRPLTYALEENLEDGIILDRDYKYTVQASVAGGGVAALNHYLFACTSKLLRISMTGIQIG